MAEHQLTFINDIVTPKGRAMFLHLAAPDEGGTYSDGKYKLRILFDKQATDMSKMREAVLECARKAWSEPNIKLKDINTPFNDGDNKPELDGHTGAIYVNAKRKGITKNDKPNPPTLVGLKVKGQPGFPKVDADAFYPGCDIRCVLTAMSYEGTEQVRQADGSTVREKYRGVTFLLETVQFLGDNDRFSGGSGNSTSALDDGEFELEAGELTSDDGIVEEGPSDAGASNGDGGDDDLF